MCRKFRFHDFPLEIMIWKLQKLKIFACGAELDSQLTESKPLETTDSQLSEFPIKWVKSISKRFGRQFPIKWIPK